MSPRRQTLGKHPLCTKRHESCTNAYGHMQEREPVIVWGQRQGGSMMSTILTGPGGERRRATASSAHIVLVPTVFFPIYLNIKAHAHVLAQAVAAAEDAGVPYTVTLRWGTVPHAILQTADERDCDLIVMGSPACPGWPHILGGYITKKVVAKARQTVLIVGSAPSRLPGTTTTHWSRTLVVTAGIPSATGAVEYALTLAQTYALHSGHRSGHRFSS